MKNLQVFAAIGAGVAMLLLPFAFDRTGTTQFLQLDAPKLFAAFMLGNAAFAFIVARDIDWSLGLAHIIFAYLALHTGFGSIQLYPFVYWTAALAFALWHVSLPDQLRALVWTGIICGAIATVLFSLLQIMKLDPVFHYDNGIALGYPLGFFGQHTKMGSYVAPVTCFLISLFPFLNPNLSRLRRNAISFIIGIMIGVCFYTGSSFTIAALFAGLLPLLPRKYFWIPATGFVVVVLAWFMWPTSSAFSSNGRFDIWRATWDAAVNNSRWLTGYGPGSFPAFFASNFQPQNTLQHGAFLQSHNDYLQVVFEGGALGSASMVLVLMRIFQAIWKNPSRGASCFVLAMLVNAMGNFPWQMSPHYFVGILSVAIVLKGLRNPATL